MDRSMRINHHQYHGGKSSASSSYSVWSNFFLAAGIPSAVANEYAITFSQHRIQINMLKEINKEILIDMGIKAMGDIIAILRHAKDLCTQDELKSGGLKATPLEHGELSLQQHSEVANINQRTSATTGRLVPSILSLVGSKVTSSRADNIERTSISTQSIAGKRPSNISYSESKRLRVDQNKKLQQAPSETEKTLTVRYPSVEAMAKVQQRIFEARGGITNKTSIHQPSIKSRLGMGRPQPSTETLTSSSHNNTNNSFASPVGRDRPQHQQRKPIHTGNGPMGLGKYNTQDTNGRYSANRKSNVFAHDDVMRSRTSRLKSTVFNRLGEGPG